MTPGEQMQADADFWGLTRSERIRYFRRISRYWAGKAAYHADKADRRGHRAMLLAGIACGLAIGSLIGRLLLAVFA